MDHKNKNIYESLIPGFIKCPTTLITHPIERIKVDMHMKKNLFIDKGIISYLYKGYSATLFSLAAKTIYKYPLLIHGPLLIEDAIFKYSKDKDKNNRHSILSQLAITPFLVITDTVMQAPNRRVKYMTMVNSNLTTIQTVKFLLKSKEKSGYGLGLGFWHGSKAYLIKHGIGQVSLLLSDALLRDSFIKKKESARTIEDKRKYEPNMYNPWYILAIGINGILLTILTNPFDVMMTRIASQLTNNSYSYSKTLIDIVKQEGIYTLFKGTSLRVIPRTITVIYTSLTISWGRGY